MSSSLPGRGFESLSQFTPCGPHAGPGKDGVRTTIIEEDPTPSRLEICGPPEVYRPHSSHKWSSSQDCFPPALNLRREEWGTRVTAHRHTVEDCRDTELSFPTCVWFSGGSLARCCHFRRRQSCMAASWETWRSSPVPSISMQASL